MTKAACPSETSLLSFGDDDLPPEEAERVRTFGGRSSVSGASGAGISGVMVTARLLRTFRRGVRPLVRARRPGST